VKRWLSFCLLFPLLSVALFAEPVDDATFEASLAISTAIGVPRSVAARQLFEETGDKKTGSRGDFSRPSLRAEDDEGFHSAGGYQVYMNPKNLNWLLDTFWWGAGETEAFDVYNYVHNTKMYARYMVYLHNRFGSWYLAAARYNCGPNRPDIPADSRAYAMRIISAP
jgi:hypothetical protein